MKEGVGAEVTKTYFYVFLTGDKSEREREIGEAFGKFWLHHRHDSKVKTFTLSEDPKEFEQARSTFDIRRLPAFVITDEPYFEGGEQIDPYLSFERGVFQVYDTKEKLYDLISDIHYLVKDEGILKLKVKTIETRVTEFLKKAWEEVKDVVGVGIKVTAK